MYEAASISPHKIPRPTGRKLDTYSAKAVSLHKKIKKRTDRGSQRKKNEKPLPQRLAPFEKPKIKRDEQRRLKKARSLYPSRSSLWKIRNRRSRPPPPQKIQEKKEKSRNQQSRWTSCQESMQATGSPVLLFTGKHWKHLKQIHLYLISPPKTCPASNLSFTFPAHSLLKFSLLSVREEEEKKKSPESSRQGPGWHQRRDMVVKDIFRRNYLEWLYALQRP